MPQPTPPARDTATRCADARRRLDNDIDAWVATAGSDGPWLVPLTFIWDGERLWFATESTGRTARNLAEQPRVRVSLGHTRDVVMVDGEAELIRIDAATAEDVERFATKGMDPRGWADVLFTVSPERVQAWREENELRGRTIMRDGHWLA